MSNKGVMLNSRPADASGSGAMGGGLGGGGFPESAVGNYKGIMLCNRPPEVGAPNQNMSSGEAPFANRVNPQAPLGWTPSMKLVPRSKKKKSNPDGVLSRHKQFLKNLEVKKEEEREERRYEAIQEQGKFELIKDNAEKQRIKVKQLQEEQESLAEMEFEEAVQTASQGQKSQASNTFKDIGGKLTEDNLSKLGGAKKQGSRKPSATGKKSKKQKPAWATTPQQAEDEKESEVDDLLDFANDLNYDAYVEDFEVRQALAVIKDRVEEIKQDDDMKNAMVDEWNQEREEWKRTKNADKDETESQAQRRHETRSVYSYKSGASGVSRVSYQERVAAAQKRGQDTKSQWNESVVSRQMTTEDKIAARIASEVLRDNQKLRSVHSGASIKKILEREAKKHLLATKAQGNQQIQALGLEPATYKGPVVARINTRERDPLDPSNLPYLHKHPAI